jgi:hypothetical protein
VQLLHAAAAVLLLLTSKVALTTGQEALLLLLTLTSWRAYITRMTSTATTKCSSAFSEAAKLEAGAGAKGFSRALVALLTMALVVEDLQLLFTVLL